MKKIFILMLTIASVAMSMVSCCSDEEPYYTAGPNDFPRILNTDIPDWKKGQPGYMSKMYTNQNFKYNVLYTPVDYTTITWIVDGAKVWEGASVDEPLLAGVHLITIKASTVAGKQCSRTFYQEVEAIEGDPILDDAPSKRWIKPGASTELSGSNLQGITSAKMTMLNPENEVETIVELENVVVKDNSVSFTVPTDAPLGNYTLMLVNEEGKKYGVGKVTVSNEQYVDPGVQKIKLWEGSQVINWGESNINIPAEALADVPVGTVIKVYYNVPEAEYHSMRITTPWWGDNPEDNLVGQFDITADTPNPFEFVYDEHCKALVEERGAMLLVGFGYEATNVEYEIGIAPKEETLWEGSQVINWGESNVLLSSDKMSDVAVGKTICVYYDVPDAEYHALRITTPWWGDNASDNLVGQFDITEDTPNPFEFVYDDNCKALVDEREGMLIVGFGYKVTKVTVK